MMGTVSPGFKGRGRRSEVSAELPPGQYLVEDFPVLSAGPTPDIDLEDWELTITNGTGEQQRWDWTGFRALPSQPVTVDLHCVTHWSKLGRGVAGHPARRGGDQRQLCPGRILCRTSRAFGRASVITANGDPWREQRYWGD